MNRRERAWWRLLLTSQKACAALWNHVFRMPWLRLIASIISSSAWRLCKKCAGNTAANRWHGMLTLTEMHKRARCGKFALMVHESVWIWQQGIQWYCCRHVWPWGWDSQLFCQPLHQCVSRIPQCKNQAIQGTATWNRWQVILPIQTNENLCLIHTFLRVTRFMFIFSLTLYYVYELPLWKGDNTTPWPLSYHYYSNAYKSNMTLKVVSSCSNIDFQDVT